MSIVDKMHKVTPKSGSYWEVQSLASALRTLLFAPGNHPQRVAKVFSCGADAVILDLEDAVATAEKAAARATVVEALKRDRRCPAYVRVNAADTEFCYRDLVSVVGPWLDGIVLPKVESADGLRGIEWLLRQLEREAGLTEPLDLLPIVETGKGLAASAEIAAAGTRVQRLAFGAGDFTFDVDSIWSRNETELDYARSQIVTHSRAAGLAAPLDTVWVDLQDAEGLELSARIARSRGFGGKMCIHPAQVPVVNSVFTPSEADVTFAKKVVDAFDRAEAEGLAAIQVDGKFIDYPIVYRAQRVLASMEGLDSI